MKILLIVALLLSSNIVSSDLSELLNPIEENEVASGSKMVRPNRSASHKYQWGRPYCLYTAVTTELPFSYIASPYSKGLLIASGSKRVRPNRNAFHKYQCGSPYCLYTGNLLNDMCKHVGACWGTKWGCCKCGFRVTSPWVIRRHRQLHKGEEANTLVSTITEPRVLYKCTLGKQRVECTLPTCNVERHEVTEYYLMINCVRSGCTYKGNSPNDMSKHEKYCTGHELGCTGCNYTVDSMLLMEKHLQAHYVERMIFS